MLENRPLLTITGFSGSGKTTFIEKLIPALKARGYFPGYLKHAGWKYDLDVPGKDSYRQLAAGAVFSSVFTEEKWVFHQLGPMDETFLGSHPQADIIILEGFKHSDYPKIVSIHPSSGVPDELSWNHPESAKKEKIWAYLTADELQANQINQLTRQSIAFQRDHIEKTADHLLHQLTKHCEQSFSLKGAVMIGGKSTRMGKDKAWLDYGRGAHAHYLFELLAQHPMIQDVVYSGLPKASFPSGLNEEKILQDRFVGFGPLGGFLTLFEASPQSAWLVLACDLAKLQEETVEYLIQHRNPLKMATVFVNDQQRFEPLAAIYEPHMGLYLKRMLVEGKYSLQRVFSQLPVNKITVPLHLQQQLINVNTPQERDHILQR
ncbi:MAG: molybdopterin-guanine dinucleotide biosynthesis protein B [SAR324 cluster bacterium]|nr:molybdopterin-guanine dinucleotide biosynthesis protein B [SAR324 cluster bacterium]